MVDGRAITRDRGQDSPFPVPPEDPLQHSVVRVLAPRGALVLWDGRIPHQNYPNTGSEFRVVQYLAFSLADQQEMEERQELLRKRLLVRSLSSTGSEDCFFPKGLSALGREIFCLPADSDAADTGSLDPSLAQAIRLTVQAGEEELRGELQTSVQSMRRAEKLWPEISAWHDAIFGV